MIHRRIGIDEVASHVSSLFVDHQNQAPLLIYHNLLHTQNVVARAKEIASYYLLGESETFIVICAAWFHDCGHLFGPAMGHELRSVLKMKQYMEPACVDEVIIHSIESCILATQLPGNPARLIEEILCDADLYHFGTKEFFITDTLVRKEYELRNNFSPANWDEISLSLLQNHKFHTQYCRDLLAAGKNENISLLQQKISRKN